jgi:hypothetical protein
MTDCPNAEMRDRLPDLLHERLDVSARAAVMAHVARCADCRAELTLLREARIALTSDMRAVDVAAITSAVIAQRSAPAVRVLPRHQRARVWTDWRVAASIALVAIGGASFALIRSHHVVMPLPHMPVVAKAPPAESVSIGPAVTPPAQVARHSASAPAAAAAELSAAGGVSDLSDSDLRALLDDLQSIDAEPSTDPEPVSVRVTLPGRGGGGGGTD